jgi:prepilin-type N-terminal cleavage/methylation domain-containing protein/prepilin-type processing-associated H-X9-DG protein
MNRFTRRGFTLAEVLVVIAVIALLVAVLMPVLNSAFTYQRYVNCSHNLSELGVAYGTMYSNRRMMGLTGIGTLGTGWPKMFEPFVSGSQSVFWCPAAEGEGIWKKASLDAYYDEVYISGVYQGAMSLSESASPWVWRLSQTQFDVFKNTAGHGQNYPYVANGGYKPDDNPNLYYYCLEDNAWKGGGDKDFWDIMFKIETDGINYKITCVQGITGYVHNFYVVKGGVKEIIWADCRNFDGKSVEVKGTGIASYGINTVGDRVLPGMGGKILIMDYDLVIAAGSPYDDTGGRASQLAKDWQPDPTNPANGPHFARHYRKANVLFTDGSVKLMPIQDIHPGIPQNCPQYWDPK